MEFSLWAFVIVLIGVTLVIKSTNPSSQLGLEIKSISVREFSESMSTEDIKSK